MNKSKAKLSLVTSQPKSSAKKIREESAAHTGASAEEAALEQLATVDFWKNEISGLRAEKFDSIEDAVSKVIEQVIERMQLQGGQEDVKEFLRLVFESSESLQAALRKTLKISY